MLGPRATATAVAVAAPSHSSLIDARSWVLRSFAVSRVPFFSRSSPVPVIAPKPETAQERKIRIFETRKKNYFVSLWTTILEETSLANCISRFIADLSLPTQDECPRCGDCCHCNPTCWSEACRPCSSHPCKYCWECVLGKGNLGSARN